MVEFIKTCDQYPCKFNSSIVLPLYVREKQMIDFQKILIEESEWLPSDWSGDD